MDHLRSTVSIPGAVISGTDVPFLFEEGHIVLRLSSLKNQLHASNISHNVTDVVPEWDARAPRLRIANVAAVGCERSETRPLCSGCLEIGEAVEDLVVVSRREYGVQSLKNCV